MPQPMPYPLSSSGLAQAIVRCGLKFCLRRTMVWHMHSRAKHCPITIGKCNVPVWHFGKCKVQWFGTRCRASPFPTNVLVVKLRYAYNNCRSSDGRNSAWRATHTKRHCLAKRCPGTWTRILTSAICVSKMKHDCNDCMQLRCVPMCSSVMQKRAEVWGRQG